LGNLVELKGESENALQIYKTARSYGYEGDLIVARIINSAKGESAYYHGKAWTLTNKLKILQESKNGDLDYVYQIETSLIVLSVIVILLVIALIVLFSKWKNLKKANLTS
jgi:ethanolamine ammonia-lyase large subunit